MAGGSQKVIKARWIFPVSRPPINGGWLRLVDGSIAEVGRGDAPAGAHDLGDVAVLPGLVNAHTHLEFSDCRHPIGQPGMPLADWIGRVVAARQDTSAESTASAIRAGAAEVAACGTRLVGEISTPPCEVIAEPALDVISFAEVLGLSSSRAEERYTAAERHLVAHRHAGISPHAPYSTPLSLTRRCVDLARAAARPLSMHVAESPAERELLTYGTGCFADSLTQLGVWREGLFPWGDNAIPELLQCLSDAPRALVVHGNDLREDEIDFLSRHDHMSVVYCPRTHAFFGYDPHPVDRMLQAGVRVALGTDSRASNPDLDVWRELQFLLHHRSDLDPADVLRMVTLHGAEALGCSEMGRIEPGCDARLTLVATSASTLDGCYEAFADQSSRPLS